MKHILILSTLFAVAYAYMGYGEDDFKRGIMKKNRMIDADGDDQGWNGNMRPRPRPRPGHRHHFPPPPFLREVSRSARRAFYKIVMNPDTSVNQKKTQLDEWAKKQGGNITEELHTYETKVHKFLEALNKNTTDTINSLADAYNKVHSILANHDLTPKEQFKQLKDLKLPSATARSLRAVMFIVAHPRRPCADCEDDDAPVRPGLGFMGMGGGFGFGKHENRIDNEDDTDDEQ